MSTRARGLLRLGAAAALTLLALSLRPGLLGAQQLGEGMSREGTVGPMSDSERRLFSGLICTCGCPRESLATCTCDIAAHRREVLREGLAKGTPSETLQAEYVRTYGPEALALPPNRGAHRLVWLAPLGAVILGSVFLGRWLRKRGQAPPSTPSPTSSTGPLPPGAPSAASRAESDAYDSRLEDELRQLDEDR